MATFPFSDATNIRPGSRKDFFERRRSMLEKERSSFISHWKDLSQYISPRRGRFLIDDKNKGDKRYELIVNNIASRALRVSTAGLQDGVASKSRPWFELRTADRSLMESQNVKVWLHDVTELIRQILNSGNFYEILPQVLRETLLFGTGAMSHVDDFEDVARFYAHTVGSYSIAMDERQVVNTFVRHFTMSVEAMVRKYGYDRCSMMVRNAYDNGNYSTMYPVVQYVSSNDNADPEKPWASDMPFQATHYEPTSVQGDPEFLRVDGFNEFPVYIPRWSTTDGDTWGTECPGMISLGDTRSVQHSERKRAQGIDKQVDPPLQGPASLRGRPVSALPGGLNIYTAQDQHFLKPVYQVTPAISEMSQDIERQERRINEAFYVDLFMAISSMEGIQPRNQLDLMYRNQERLLQLGPVLEHLHGELLGPMINRVFNQTARANILPEPPAELEGGEEIEIQYVSTLAMAQRAVATEGLDRLALFVGGLAQIKPEVVDKFDADQAVDEFASAIGVTPRVVVPDETVAADREQRAAMANIAQMAELAQTGAETAKAASETDTTGENLLTDVRDANQPR